jgi:hypothetical protein
VFSSISNKAEHHALGWADGFLYKGEDVTKIEASTGVAAAKAYVLKRAHCSAHPTSLLATRILVLALLPEFAVRVTMKTQSST